MSLREELTAEIKAGRSKFEARMHGQVIQFQLPQIERHWKDSINEERAAKLADEQIQILAS